MKQYLYSIKIEVLRRIVAILLPEKQDEFEGAFNNAGTQLLSVNNNATPEEINKVGLDAYFGVTVDEVVNFISALSFDEQFKLYQGDIAIADLLMLDETFNQKLKVKEYSDAINNDIKEIERQAMESFKRFIEEGTNGFKSLVRTEKETFTEFSQTAEKNVRTLAGRAETYANYACTYQNEADRFAREAKQSATNAENSRKNTETLLTNTAGTLRTWKAVAWVFVVLFVLSVGFTWYIVKSPNVTVNDSDIRQAMKDNEIFQTLIQKEVERQIKNLPPPAAIEQPDNTDTDAGVEGNENSQQPQPQPPPEEKPVETPSPKDDSGIEG